MGNKKYINLSVILMVISGIFFSLAMVYYALEDDVLQYRYSDSEEYTTINRGIEFINKLPIQFNIINKYFSDINNLDQNDKEQILFAYAVKNYINVVNCGPTNKVTSYICFKKEDINSKELQKVFNLKLKVGNTSQDIFIDSFGTFNISNQEDEKLYKVVVNTTNNNNYIVYTKFDHYKQENDKDIIYVYQGYIKANTKEDEVLELRDFITGDIVYSGTSNGYNDFKEDISKRVKELQLYKYELKKYKDGSYYLYGYNPVKS